MFDSIAGAYSGLTAAKDIIKTMLDIKEAAAVSTKALELNGVILDVQDKLFNARTEREDMQSRIRELEQKVTELNNWESVKQRYQLHPLAPGTWVYRLKSSEQPAEPEHDICPNCYELGSKSILQAGGSTGGGWHHSFMCPRCKTTYRGEEIPFSI